MTDSDRIQSLEKAVADLTVTVATLVKMNMGDAHDGDDPDAIMRVWTAAKQIKVSGSIGEAVR